jgi:hypothetical protein
MLQSPQTALPFSEDEYPRNWPMPEPGQGFADVVRAMPRMEATWAAAGRQRLDKFFDRLPDRLNEDAAVRAAGLLGELLDEYPSDSPIELLWMLAADATEPARGGRPAVWSGGVDGRDLYDLVEAGLETMGLRRDSKKGLSAVIEVIRANAPDTHGRVSLETLRVAYYRARAAVTKRS